MSFDEFHRVTAAICVVIVVFYLLFAGGHL